MNTKRDTVPKVTSRTYRLLPWAFLLSIGSLNAASMTVYFDVQVYAKFDYLSRSYDPSFTSLQIIVPISFDSGVTGTVGDATNGYFSLGVPLIGSPLTNHLPYGPAANTIAPDAQHRLSAISHYDFGSGQMGSYFQFKQDQYDQEGPTSFFSYDLELKSRNRPALANLSAFSSAEVLPYLESLQISGTQFDFDEYSDHFDSSTLLYLGGTGYSGFASISAISAAPEPSMAALFNSLALVAFFSRWARLRKWWLTRTGPVGLIQGRA